MLLLLLTAIIMAPTEALTEAPTEAPAHVAEATSFDTRAACEAASLVLPDMRYAQGYQPKGDFSHPVVDARIQRCADLAARVDEDMAYTVIAVAYRETNFDPDAVGAAGERGMLQVIPRYHCVDEFSNGQGGCVDPEGAGIKFLTHLTGRHDLNTALRRYNGSQTYATAVADNIERVWTAHKG